jgi:tetratricopeptide (TPR) repeat protein
VNLSPTDPRIRYNRGRVLLDLMRYDEAAVDLEAAWRATPDDPGVLHLLAVAEKYLGHNTRSAHLLQKLLRLEPQNADAHYLLGQNFFYLGREADAISEWKTTLEVDPEHAEALYNLSRVMGRRDPQAARAYRERVQKLKQKGQTTDRAEMLNILAVNSSNTRDWPQAIAQFREAVQLCGSCRLSAHLHKSLALTYCHSGDLENCERELRFTVTLLPDDLDIRKSLEIIQIRRQNPPGVP